MAAAPPIPTLEELDAPARPAARTAPAIPTLEELTAPPSPPVTSGSAAPGTSAPSLSGGVPVLPRGLPATSSAPDVTPPRSAAPLSVGGAATAPAKTTPAKTQTIRLQVPKNVAPFAFPKGTAEMGFYQAREDRTRLPGWMTEKSREPGAPVKEIQGREQFALAKWYHEERPRTAAALQAEARRLETEKAAIERDFQAGKTIPKNRLVAYEAKRRGLEARNQEIAGLSRRYADEVRSTLPLADRPAIHGGMYYPEEIAAGADQPGLVNRALGAVAGIVAPATAAAQQRLPGIRASLQWEGRGTPLPAIPYKDRQRGIREADAVRRYLRQEGTTAFRNERQRQAFEQDGTRGWTEFQQRLLGPMRSQFQVEREAQQIAKVAESIGVDALAQLAAMGASTAVSAWLRNPATKAIVKRVAPQLFVRYATMTAPTLAAEFEPLSRAAMNRLALRAVPHVTAGAAAGAAAAGVTAGGVTRAQGGTWPETLQAGVREAPAGALTGAVTSGFLSLLEGGLRSGWNPKRSPQLIERYVQDAQARGLAPERVGALREALTRVAQAPAAAKGGLIRQIAQEFGPEIGYTPPARQARAGTRTRAGAGEYIPPEQPQPTPRAPKAGPLARTAAGEEIALRETSPQALVRVVEGGDPQASLAAQQWLDRHEAYELQMDAALPEGEPEAAWKQSWPRSEARKQHGALTTHAQAVAQSDPALAALLQEAAEEVRRDAVYAHVRNTAPGESIEPTVAPPQVSVWRRLTPEQRAALPDPVKRTLLIQDISNSQRVITPEKLPIHGLEEFDARTRRDLGGYADQLFGSAQDVAARRYVPPVVAEPEVTPTPEVVPPPQETTATAPEAAPQGAEAMPAPEEAMEAAGAVPEPFAGIGRTGPENIKAAVAQIGQAARQVRAQQQQVGKAGATREKAARPVATVERRVDTARRKAIEEMTPEEKDAEIAALREAYDEAEPLAYTDQMMGLRNRNDWMRNVDEVGDGNYRPKGGGVLAIVDADGLSYVNDNYKYISGDRLLKALGNAIRQAGLTENAFRIGGDEIAFHADNATELAARLEALREIQEKQVVTLEREDGTRETISGFSLSFGIGKDFKDAGYALGHQKEERTAAGLRARGKGKEAGEAARPPQLVAVGEGEGGRREGAKPTGGGRDIAEARAEVAPADYTGPERRQRGQAVATERREGLTLYRPEEAEPLADQYRFSPLRDADLKRGSLVRDTKTGVVYELLTRERNGHGPQWTVEAHDFPPTGSLDDVLQPETDRTITEADLLASYEHAQPRPNAKTWKDRLTEEDWDRLTQWRDNEVTLRHPSGAEVQIVELSEPDVEVKILNPGTSRVLEKNQKKLFMMPADVALRWEPKAGTGKEAPRFLNFLYGEEQLLRVPYTEENVERIDEAVRSVAGRRGVEPNLIGVMVEDAGGAQREWEPPRPTPSEQPKPKATEPPPPKPKPAKPAAAATTPPPKPRAAPAEKPAESPLANLSQERIPVKTPSEIKVGDQLFDDGLKQDVTVTRINAKSVGVARSSAISGQAFGRPYTVAVPGTRPRLLHLSEFDRAVRKRDQKRLAAKTEAPHKFVPTAEDEAARAAARAERGLPPEKATPKPTPAPVEAPKAPVETPEAHAARLLEEDLGRAVVDAGKVTEFAKALLVAAKQKTGNTAAIIRAQRGVTVNAKKGELHEHTRGLMAAAKAAGLTPDDVRAAAKSAGVAPPPNIGYGAQFRDPATGIVYTVRGAAGARGGGQNLFTYDEPGKTGKPLKRAISFTADDLVKMGMEQVAPPDAPLELTDWHKASIAEIQAGNLRPAETRDFKAGNVFHYPDTGVTVQLLEKPPGMSWNAVILDPGKWAGKGAEVGTIGAVYDDQLLKSQTPTNPPPIPGAKPPRKPPVPREEVLLPSSPITPTRLPVGRRLTAGKDMTWEVVEPVYEREGVKRVKLKLVAKGEKGTSYRDVGDVIDETVKEVARTMQFDVPNREVQPAPKGFTLSPSQQQAVAAVEAGQLRPATEKDLKRGAVFQVLGNHIVELTVKPVGGEWEARILKTSNKDLEVGSEGGVGDHRLLAGKVLDRSVTPEAGAKGGEVRQEQAQIQQRAGPAPKPGRAGETGNAKVDSFLYRTRSKPREGWLERQRAGWERTRKAAQKAYSRLEDRGEFASVMRALDWFKQGFDLAEGSQFRREREYYRGLTPDEMQVTRSARVMRDMEEEIAFQKRRHLDAGLEEASFTPRLPGEITEADVQQALAGLKGQITPKIEAALKKETAGDRAVLDDLFRARGGVTGEEPTRLERGQWFHHMIALYQQGKQASGAWRPGAKPGKLGALKARGGSDLDYITNLIEARADWMPAAIRQTRLYDFVKLLEDEHDISRDVHWNAMVANDPAMAGVWNDLAADRTDAAAVAKLQALAADGLLPDTMARRWGTLLAELRSGQALSPDAQRMLPEYARWLNTPRKVAGAKVLRSAARAQALKTATGKDTVRPEDILRLPEYERFVGWEAPRGHVLEVVRSLPEHMIDQALQDLGGELRVDVKPAQKMLQQGMVIPRELAETLNEIGVARADDFHNYLERGLRRATSLWKWQRLFNLAAAVPYFTNNARSGFNALLRENHQALRPKHALRAMTETARVQTTGKVSSPEFESWLEEGGLAGMLETHETGAFVGFAPRAFFEDRGGTRAWMAYNTSVAFRWPHIHREATERYGSYLAFLEDIREHGRPTRFGASVPKEVLALPTPEAQAFRLAQDLSVDYTRTSEAGQWIADHVAPFWRYQDGNFRREKQIWANIAADPNLTAALGKRYMGAGVGAAKLRQLGRVVAGALVLDAMTHAWNWAVAPEEEEKLSNEQRFRPHLLIPAEWSPTGKLIYFDALGNASDLLGWAGLDNTFGWGYYDAWANGRMTLGEIAKDMAKSLFDRGVGAVSPLYKAPLEFVTKRTTYPTVFPPRPVKDRWEPVFEQLNAGWLLRWYQGRPLKADRWGGVIRKPFKEIEKLNEGTYYEVRGDVRSWLARNDPEAARGVRESPDTPRANALWLWREADRLGDEKTALQRLAEARLAGVTRKEFGNILLRTEPLADLDGDQEPRYLKDLTPERKEATRRAYLHWQEMVAPGSEPVIEEDLGQFIRQTRRAVRSWVRRNNALRELEQSDPELKAAAKAKDRERERVRPKR